MNKYAARIVSVEYFNMKSIIFRANIATDYPVITSQVILALQFIFQHDDFFFFSFFGTLVEAKTILLAAVRESQIWMSEAELCMLCLTVPRMNKSLKSRGFFLDQRFDRSSAFLG